VETEDFVYVSITWYFVVFFNDDERAHLHSTRFV
jgi:hypothetical protein